MAARPALMLCVMAVLPLATKVLYETVPPCRCCAAAVCLRPVLCRRCQSQGAVRRRGLPRRRSAIARAPGEHRFGHGQRSGARPDWHHRHRRTAQGWCPGGNSVRRAGGGQQHRRDLEGHGQDAHSADGAYGHRLQGRHRTRQAVLHQGQARLWPRRDGRQGRRGGGFVCDEDPAAARLQAIRAGHAAAQHQRGNRLQGHARVDRARSQAA